MNKKEIATKEDLFEVLDLLDSIGIHYWVDGGWGVDILVGKQTREHRDRDIDINFDAQHTEKLLKILNEYGYEVITDLKPVRIELYNLKLSYIDIHPFILSEDGSAKQSNLEGGWYEFEADYFGNEIFEERNIPCISAKGQQIFHTGYELRDVDKHDIKNIEKILNKIKGEK